MAGKGTVKPLADVLRLDDLARASHHIQDAIQSQTQQLQELRGFAEDNAELQKLLKNLPDTVSYKIMVPFGKAAFMPGHLIHTNEMMVFLGDGYYAERSAKQTLGILERRTNFLQEKITDLNSQISDLQLEAKFASNAAEEVTAGIVEIREEYLEPTASDLQRVGASVRPVKLENPADEDEQDERIMQRLAELESQEAIAEMNHSDEKIDSTEKDEKEEEDEGSEDDEGEGEAADEYYDHDDEEEEEKLFQPSSSNISEKQTSFSSDFSPQIRTPADLLQLEAWKKRSWDTGKKSRISSVPSTSSSVAAAVEKKKKKKKKKKSVRFAHDVDSEIEKSVRISSGKAFTGSVVERNYEQPPNIPQNVEGETRVSRFKMMRGSTSDYQLPR